MEVKESNIPVRHPEYAKILEIHNRTGIPVRRIDSRVTENKCISHVLSELYRLRKRDIPKTPVNTKIYPSDDSVFNAYQVECPGCESDFITLCQSKRCPECGQLLKWQVKGEENGKTNESTK